MRLKGVICVLLINSISCDERAKRVKRIVGGIPADVPPVDDPVIYTRFAGRTARVEGVKDFPHYVFRGIKYALPPTLQNRFLRPIQKLLEGEVKATDYPSPCIQPHPGTNTVVGSEDCLALNVFTPELPKGTEGLPVVVWIHGGGFRYGSASQYGVRHLVGKRLVVVTIQYRLGSLGFLSTGDKHLPGNAALWDMVLAIQWVRNYIGFFGGNPYRIVVMGHGTGASSALLIALSNVAKGLASGVVAMSGSAVSNWAIDHTPQNTAEEIAHQNGCPTSSSVTMVKCLQLLSPEQIIRGDSNVEFRNLQSRGFMSRLSGGSGTAPVSEGYNDGRSLPGLIQDEPINDFNEKRTPKIPLLTGITRDETKAAVTGHLKNSIENKLKNVPNFLDNVLVKDLRNLISTNKLLDLSSNKSIVGSLLPLNFGNYLYPQKTLSLQGALEKVAETTADALFNVPAFLTVDRWSKNGAPTYLYRFEHLGKCKKGSAFLRGTPMIGNETTIKESNDTIGHGDELAYLFDVNDIDGKSLELDESLNENDRKVRNIFTQLIADFARHGKVQIDGEDVESFSSENNNFIQISAKPSLAKNFKFCEMGLWFNIVDRLRSTTCSHLNALQVPLDNLNKVVSGLTNPLSNIVNEGTLYQPLGVLNKNPLSLMGQGKSESVTNKQKSMFGNINQINTQDINKNPVGLLGLTSNQNRNNKPKSTSLLGGFLG